MLLLFRSPGRMPCPNYEAVEFQPRTVDNPAPQTLGAQPVFFKPDETK